MKTQKEAIALKLKIDQLRELQEETRRKAREAEMIREGIPLNREEERGYKDRRFIRDDRGGGGGRRDDRGGRDDRRGTLLGGFANSIAFLGGGRYDDRGGRVVHFHGAELIGKKCIRQILKAYKSGIGNEIFKISDTNF